MAKVIPNLLDNTRYEQIGFASIGSDYTPSFNANKKLTNSRSSKYIDYSESDQSLIKKGSSKLIDYKPVYLSNDLYDMLSSRFDQVRYEDVRVLEASLYRIGRTLAQEIKDNYLNFEVVDTMHHIQQLKKIENELSLEELNMLNYNFDETMITSPSAQVEYKLYQDILEFISALCIQWKITQLDDFSYRYSAITENIKMLNLPALNQDVFTMEGLWLSVALKYYPLNEVADDNTLQLAGQLKDAIDDVIRAISQLNLGANYSKNPGLEGHFALMSPELAQHKHWEPDNLSTKTKYHKLNQPDVFYSWCFKTKNQKINTQLKRFLENFEFIYRSFERALISCLLSSGDFDASSVSLKN